MCKSLKTISCTCLGYSEEEKVKFLTIPILRTHVEKLLFFIVIYPNSFEHKRFVTVMKSTDKWQNPSPPLQLLFFTVHNTHRPAIIINILFGLVPLFSHFSLCVYQQLYHEYRKKKPKKKQTTHKLLARQRSRVTSSHYHAMCKKKYQSVNYPKEGKVQNNSVYKYQSEKLGNFPQKQEKN